jgi:hypothetical protein
VGRTVRVGAETEEQGTHLLQALHLTHCCSRSCKLPLVSVLKGLVFCRFVVGQYVLALSEALRTAAKDLFSVNTRASPEADDQVQGTGPSSIPPGGNATTDPSAPPSLNYQFGHPLVQKHVEPAPSDPSNNTSVNPPSPSRHGTESFPTAMDLESHGQQVDARTAPAPSIGGPAGQKLGGSGPAQTETEGRPMPGCLSRSKSEFIAVQSPGQWPPVQDNLRALLQKAYALYAEFCLMPDGTATWASVVRPAVVEQLRDAEENDPAHVTESLGIWATEGTFAEYSRAYIGALAEAGNIERLLGLLNVLKKRYRRIALGPRVRPTSFQRPLHPVNVLALQFFLCFRLSPFKSSLLAPSGETKWCRSSLCAFLKHNLAGRRQRHSPMLLLFTFLAGDGVGLVSPGERRNWFRAWKTACCWRSNYIQFISAHWKTWSGNDLGCQEAQS